MTLPLYGYGELTLWRCQRNPRIPKAGEEVEERNVLISLKSALQEALGMSGLSEFLQTLFTENNFIKI